MKKLIYLLLSILPLAACNDDETYADQKDKERDAVGAFLRRDPVVLYDNGGDTLLAIPRINVISQEQFEKQDSTTDLSRNEFVLFTNTGVYMQVVRKGTGKPLRPGERKRVICRYWEYNILGDSLQTTNQTTYWTTSPDILDVSNNSGTINASFNTTVNGGGAMYLVYKTTVVPKGWIVPLSYVNLGRHNSPDEGVAKVRLIVPHSSGQTDATSNVYPCFYEITYEAMRD